MAIVTLAYSDTLARSKQGHICILLGQPAPFPLGLYILPTISMLSSPDDMMDMRKGFSSAGIHFPTRLYVPGQMGACSAPSITRAKKMGHALPGSMRVIHGIATLDRWGRDSL